MTIIACPLSSCPWELPDADPVLEARNVEASPGIAAAMGVPLDAFLSIRNSQGARRREQELQRHLDTHPLIEWLTEVVRLQTEVAALRAGHSIPPAFNPGAATVNGQLFTPDPCRSCGEVVAHRPDCPELRTERP